MICPQTQGEIPVEYDSVAKITFYRLAHTSDGSEPDVDAAAAVPCMCSTIADRIASLSGPLTTCTTRLFLMKWNVGIAVTLYFFAREGSLSVSTFTKVTWGY